MIKEKAGHACPEDKKPQAEIITEEFLQEIESTIEGDVFLSADEWLTWLQDVKILIAKVRRLKDCRCSNEVSHSCCCCTCYDNLCHGSSCCDCKKRPDEDCPECKGDGEILPLPIGNLRHDVTLIPCPVCMS